jgi:alpha-N-acetylglucosamine transferase
MAKKYAYVSLVYGDNIFFLGAMVLAYSLKKRSPKWPIVALVTGDVPAKQVELLGHIFDRVVMIEHTPYNPKCLTGYSQRYAHVFSKLRCLQLTEYDKVLVLDIDMAIVHNIDHLFDLPAPAASPSRRDYGPVGGKVPRGEVINAGTMLIAPDSNEYDRLQAIILDPPKKYQGLKFPEQEMLSHEWEWNKLSGIYNYPFNKSLKGFHKAAILHYSGTTKPWRKYYDKDWTCCDTPQKKKFFQVWYDLYERLSAKVREKYGIDMLKITKLGRGWEYDDAAEWASSKEKKKEVDDKISE